MKKPGPLGLTCDGALNRAERLDLASLLFAGLSDGDGQEEPIEGILRDVADELSVLSTLMSKTQDLFPAPDVVGMLYSLERRVRVAQELGRRQLAEVRAELHAAQEASAPAADTTSSGAAS